MEVLSTTDRAACASDGRDTSTLLGTPQIGGRREHPPHVVDGGRRGRIIDGEIRVTVTVTLTVALAVELAATIRRRPVAPNLLLRGAQPIAAQLVTAILLLVTALQPRPVAAATPLGDAIVTAAPTAVIDGHPTMLPASEPAPSPRTVADARRAARRTLSAGSMTCHRR